jgi:hypothetical protein
MRMVSTSLIDKKVMEDFFKEHWGSWEMVLSSGVYDCSALEGFAAMNEEDQLLFKRGK